MKKVILLISLFITLIIFNNAHIYINQNSELKINFHIYTSKNITNIKGAKYLKLKFYLPQTSETAFISQVIPDATMRFYFSPPQTTLQNIYEDEHGNKVLELEWSALNSSTVELLFDGLLEYQNSNVNLSDSLDNIKDSIDTSVVQYIETSTDYVQINTPDLQYLAKQLSMDEYLVIAVVHNIFNWIKKNINYNPDHKNYRAEDVLYNREGNREGIFHLILSLLRTLSIPSRAVIGCSIPYSPKVLGNKFIDLKYEKGLYTYLEIYFPSVGWVAFDPYEFYGFPVRPFVKLGASYDFIDNFYYYFETDMPNPVFNDSYDMNIETSSDSISVESNIFQTGFNGLCLIPVFIKQYSLKDQNLGQMTNIIPYFRYETSDSEKAYKFYNKKNYLELSLKESSYYQPLKIEKRMQIKKIEIPMVNYNGSAKFQIFVYKNIDGKPGDVILKSYIKNSANILYGSPNFNDLYTGFSFPENAIDPGDYFLRVEKITSGSFQGVMYGMNYIENNRIKPCLLIEKNGIVTTNFNLIMNILYE